MVGNGVGEVGSDCCANEGDGIDGDGHVLGCYCVRVAKPGHQGRVEVREGRRANDNLTPLDECSMIHINGLTM